VSAQKYSKVKGTAMGIERVPMLAVKKIPLIFGERDVLKVALLLPGVQTVGEGSAGFNVRGSPTDQNIFYINNVPVYNTSHVAGFFSAFNSDAIDEFSLYKNYIPVRYGGRLASVFDIKSKQGPMDKTKVRGGIGLITGRVLAEGPIQKEKSSYMLAMRSTYSDWILSMVDDLEISKSKVKFADLISNFHFQLNDKNQLDLFTYISNDNMDLATKSKYDYQNIASSVNWNHYFNNNLSFKLSMAHSTYSFDEENTEILSHSYKHLNKLKHSEGNANLSLKAGEDHNLTFGINSILYNINRGNPEPLTEESQFIPISLGNEKGLESGIYLSDEWKITPELTFNGGIRYNRYSYLGPQKVYAYREGSPKAVGTIQDTLYFKKNEAVKTFQGLDFRLAGNYMFTKDLSFKVAYNRLHQYLYMLSNTVAIAPNYKWKLTDYNTEPMIGDQYSIGMYANFPAFRIELSVEGYYKKIKNLVALKNGASLFLNEFIERSTLQGKLDAYGIELMLKKPYGKTTGWINYTYSSSKALIDSEINENRINFGQPYPSNYDKPHALNFVINRDFSKRFSMSANFVYATGRPITLPTSVYYLNGIKYLNYSKRNEHRIPDYIRLDLSFNLEGNLKRQKLAHGYWSFSVYNVLGRNNAYSVYFVNEGNQIKGYKFSIFGSPVYSLSYNFKLGNYDN
jgi:outer membrane receptor protein involved in Fe transport